MGFGDTLSKLFRGEKETESGEKAGLKGGSGLVTESVDKAQASGEAATERATSPQAEETRRPESDSDTSVTKESVLEVMSGIYDPEIPVDIVNLGLVYDVEIEDGKVHVKMTLTSPGCPTAGEMVYEAQTLIEEMPGVKEATVEVVWDPPWDPSRMSEEAKQALGYY